MSSTLCNSAQEQHKNSKRAAQDQHNKRTRNLQDKQQQGARGAFPDTLQGNSLATPYQQPFLPAVLPASCTLCQLCFLLLIPTSCLGQGRPSRQLLSLSLDYLLAAGWLLARGPAHYFQTHQLRPLRTCHRGTGTPPKSLLYLATSRRSSNLVELESPVEGRGSQIEAPDLAEPTGGVGTEEGPGAGAWAEAELEAGAGEEDEGEGEAGAEEDGVCGGPSARSRSVMVRRQIGQRHGDNAEPWCHTRRMHSAARHTNRRQTRNPHTFGMVSQGQRVNREPSPGGGTITLVTGPSKRVQDETDNDQHQHGRAPMKQMQQGHPNGCGIVSLHKS